MKSFVVPCAFVVVFAGAVACSGPADSTADAARADATSPDAGPPTIDGDGDGVPAETDCDDADPAIGTESAVACDNGCGAGQIECHEGIRGECTAPIDCLCTPGGTRAIDCGMCGMQPQRCAASERWEDDGACLYEGPCAPGAVEDDMSRCGHRRRLCGSDCEWLEYEQITPQGVCDPGERVYCMGGGSVLCNEYCRAPSCVPI